MFVEDLDPFFDPDELGTDATFGSLTIPGIFLRDYVDPEGIATRQTAFITKESHGVAVDDSLVISGLTFRVVNARPDGTGVVLLFLERQ